MPEKKVEVTDHPIIAYGDGACEPCNPNGVASYGALIYLDHHTKIEKYGFIGEGEGMSNNVAEYCATLAIIRELLVRHLERAKIIIRMDSQLVVRQMSGTWKAKSGFYMKYYEEAQELKKKFVSIHWQWVSREQNSDADQLSRRAYEEYCIQHHRPIKYGKH